jgi:hypothetical protein
VKGATCATRGCREESDPAGRSPYCPGCRRTRKARRDRVNSREYRRRKAAGGASRAPGTGDPPPSAAVGGGVYLDAHQAATLQEILVDLVGIASQIDEESAQWDGGDDDMKTYAEMAAEQVGELVRCLRQPLRDSRLGT